MAKPIGSICNLDCDYCYYKGKISLFQEKIDYRMTDDLLEEYIKQYIEAHPGPVVPFGWQGGEPTLLGVGFFNKAIEFQKKYLSKGFYCENSLQTNGTLLDDEWCHFLKEKDFLVGISIDGPAKFHDVFRKDKEGNSTFYETIRGLEFLQRNKVKYNVLCVVSTVNINKPLEIYHFLKERRIKYIQFIPLVESLGVEKVSSRSIDGENYGRFLTSIFNEWVSRDIGEIFIQIFEEALLVGSGLEASLCMFKKTCGQSLVIEHNGDVYSCDHFVSKENKIGNIMQEHLREIISSPKQKSFGENKFKKLPETCRVCPIRFMCNGGCLKNRIIPTNEDDHSLNYLCKGYKQFFLYIDPFIKKIINLMRKRQSISLIKNEMSLLYKKMWKDVKKNNLCRCVSGKKYKNCCNK